MMDLFAGFETEHGTHGTPDLDPNGLKWAIKRTATTVKKPVTVEHWRQHIKGERPLGVSPILVNSTCWWGSIDIDKYDIDLLDIVKKVESMKLPLVPCRSKSGGLHLFIFFAKPLQADLVQAVLRDIAAALGFSGSEIFPKQTTVDVKRGNSASWMVMPYFGSTYDGKLKFQYGLKKTGAEMTINEFLSAAEKHKVTEEELAGLRHKKPKKEKAAFSDGPPCLQHMSEGGFPDGGRNNALFQIGIYLKRAFPSDWQTMLEQDNQKYMRPPLPSEEVTSVVKSLEKKEYEYKCKDEPMRSHCDSMVCRSRKFGVGNGGLYPEITGLSKLNTEPAVWFVDTAAGTLNLDTYSLQNYQRFHALCMEYLSICYRPLQPVVWYGILQDAMQKVRLLEAPPDIGIAGMFLEMMEQFLTNRQIGKTSEEILRGVPWLDEEGEWEGEGPRHYFRLADFQKFLNREGVKDMKRAEITIRIKKLNGDKYFKNIKGHGTNLWYVPASAIAHAPQIDSPPLPKEHI